MTREIYVTAAETAVLLRKGQRFRCERVRAADMITVAESAWLMGVDEATIRVWMRGGRCIGIEAPDGSMRVLDGSSTRPCGRSFS
jgi:hypothetical protein